LHLFPPTDSGWIPKVLTYSGLTNTGITEIWEMIDEYVAFTKANGYFEHKRHEQAKYWMYESIHNMLYQSFYQHPSVKKRLHPMEQKVLNNEVSSFVAAKQLIDLFVHMND
jgi:LAO/AO transport system kinase